VSFAADIDAGLKSAVCGWLANGGNELLGMFVVNGLRTPASAVPSAAAGLGLLALNYGCNFDPNQGGQVLARNCTKASPGGYGTIVRHWPDGSTSSETGGLPIAEFSVSPIDDKTVQLSWTDTSGKVTSGGVIWSPGTWFELVLTSGTCASTAPAPGVSPPYTYVSPTTNCTYVIELEDWVVDDAGGVTPVVKVSPGAQARASGGVVGGCNFSPVIYVPPGGGGGGGGGDGTTFPYNPGPDGPDGEPWWWDVVKGVIGSVIGAAINRMIDKLLEQKVPATVYRLVSVCETDAQGEAISQSREVQIPSLPVLDALVARADAMDDLMQGLKDFKQPICPPVKPQLTGDFYTVSFQSVAPSPVSKTRLRKYFRYRDQSYRPHIEHTQHWEHFEWDAGPVIVVSKGLPWGTPKVWAASAEEGKRVIRHAADIAGVDLDDPKHKWIVTYSDDPRYGKPGRMRVDTKGGEIVRVTTRSGPSGPTYGYGLDS
jgi:hypothetical protein